jgi:hypothetical protein
VIKKVDEKELKQISKEEKAVSKLPTISDVVKNIDAGKKTVDNVKNKIDKLSDKEVSGLTEAGKKAIVSMVGGKIGLAIYNTVTAIIDTKKKREEEDRKRKEIDDRYQQEKEQEKARRRTEEWQRQQQDDQENQEKREEPHKPDDYNSTESYMDNFLDSDSPVSFDDIDRIPYDIPDDADQATVNEWYNMSNAQGDGAATQNCSYCTAAYDLRQRGYDVEAGPWTASDDPTTIHEIMSWYDNPKAQVLEYNAFQTDKAVSTIEKELTKQGDGARGHFMLYWTNGGGHDVIYEVKNNNVTIRDCQTNEVLKLKDYMQYANTVAYFRTDNIDVNENVLDKVRKNRD